MAERTRLLEGKKFAVDRVEVPTRAGGHVRRELVVHPGAVAILPVLRDGRIVLIRNRRFAVGKQLWEIPAGTLEAGEEPAACAARELEEEAGYRAGRIRPLGAFFTTPGFCDERMFVFVADELVATAQALEDAEDIEVHPVTPGELDRMVAAGEIEDGKTLAALFLYGRASFAGGEAAATRR